MDSQKYMMYIGAIAAAAIFLVFIHGLLTTYNIGTFWNANANGTIPTNATITTSINTNPVVNKTPNSTYSTINNLSSIRIYNTSTGALIGIYNTYTVNNVSISLNRTHALPRQKISVNVLYIGRFNLTDYFLAKTLGVHYFGYSEYGSNTMLVYNNAPNASKYFKLAGLPYVYTPNGLDTRYFLQYTVNVTPTEYASNKTWIFCGGSYVAYPVQGWQSLFDNVTLSKELISNDSVINVMSRSCATLNVG